ncbi:MAG: MYXO-CTERM sorting domain-containing protein [Polyangiaceae bacterium]|jgi:uncharacterized protein (TIGR03382 family)
MMSSPYRVPGRAEVNRGWEPGVVDVDVLLAACLLGVASLIRVVGAVLRHETFGAEATLALMAVAGLAWGLHRRT